MCGCVRVCMCAHVCMCEGCERVDAQTWTLESQLGRHCSSPGESGGWLGSGWQQWGGKEQVGLDYFSELEL